jgi:tRNA dimethylallyltransferase
VVVGGTGLYFRALTRGLAEMPTVPTEAREAAEAEYREHGETRMRQVLRSVDPTAEARIAPGDRQRLVRALAVARHTGLPLSHWQAETKPAVPAGAWRGFVVEPDRDELYRRCDARLEAMVQAGALDEVRALMNRGLSKDLPIMKAVGVREFARHLAGEISLDEALEEARQATRNYAKRQLTWFRNQTPDWPRLAGSDDDVPIAA